MALVIFLRGVNIGGRRIFRPSVLAKQLKRYDAVNIGAAGTFVIRKPVARGRLRAELARRLPFDTEIIICEGSEILKIFSSNPFIRRPVRQDTARFVSILSRKPRVEVPLPVSFPSGGKWMLKILARRGRFVFGLYRRHRDAAKYFGAGDRLFRVPLTSRSWNTITAIARVTAGRET
jgi:uncharacterized protein (DUF1697 family)